MEVWDSANAFFELVGALLTWLNVRRLYIDKEVKGIQWEVTLFWLSWGIFNLFFYGPVLGLWFSWAAGALLTLANVAWIILLMYYKTGYDTLRRYRKQGCLGTPACRCERCHIAI